MLGIRSDRTDLAGGPCGPRGDGAGYTTAERREPPWTGRGSRAGSGVCGARLCAQPSVLGTAASAVCRGLCPSLGVRREVTTPEGEWLEAVHEASDEEAGPVDTSSRRPPPRPPARPLPGGHLCRQHREGGVGGDVRRHRVSS